MSVTREDIDKVFHLIPTCAEVDTVNCLREKPELKHLSIRQIREALATLAAERRVTAGELFGRDRASRSII